MNPCELKDGGRPDIADGAIPVRLAALHHESQVGLRPIVPLARICEVRGSRRWTVEQVSVPRMMR
jgi:hypothetical protein